MNRTLWGGAVRSCAPSCSLGLLLFALPEPCAAKSDAQGSVLISQITETSRVKALSEQGRLWLVTPDDGAGLGVLQSLGSDVVRVVPGGGLIVRGARADLEVRFPAAVVTPFSAIDRMPPALSETVEIIGRACGVDLNAQFRVIDRARLNQIAGQIRLKLLLTDHRGLTHMRLRSEVSMLGGRVISSNPGSTTAVVEIGMGSLIELLRDGIVLYADVWSAPETDDSIVRDASGANFLEGIAGYSGEGVVGSVMDNGLFTTHQEFMSLPPHIGLGNTEQTGHGTPVYGVIFGDGVALPEARGLMPDALGWFSSYYWLDDRASHFADLVSADVGAVFESNSWGTTRTRKYTTDSAEIDDATFRYDLLVTQSQSNTGTPDGRPQAWAKNVVSVGGINAHGTADFSDDAWEGSGSIGPAFDGRIKPDLVHFYDGVLTASDTGEDDYLVFTGTSASTPIVAGHFGLFFEMWADGAFGNPVSGGTVFEERCSSSLARAMIISTARPYPFDRTGADMGRFRQGWGVPDLQKLYDSRDNIAYWEASSPLEQGTGRTHTVRVGGDEPDLRVTMVYPDPAGLPQAVTPVVNDLSLRVESPTGEVYWGNAGLLDGIWSQTRGKADPRNTVENVFVPNPAPGLWRIDVVAASVVEDGYLATPELDAVYALVATGAKKLNKPGFRFAEDLPERIDPYVPHRIVMHGPSDAADWAGELIVTLDGMDIPIPMGRGAGQDFVATIPGFPCDSELGVRMRFESDTGAVVQFPSGGGGYPVRVSTLYRAFDTDFTTQSGWSATAPEGTNGAWEWGAPYGGGLRYDPVQDADGNGYCWMTQNGPGLTDVTGGPARLVSPLITVPSGSDPTLIYSVYLACDDAGYRPTEEDWLIAQVSVDDGASWTTVDTVGSTYVWRERRVSLGPVIGGASKLRLRFKIDDLGRDSVTEAAIDAVRVESVWCSTCGADLDGSGGFNIDDIFSFLDAFVSGSDAAECDGAPGVNVDDVLCFLDTVITGCN